MNNAQQPYTRKPYIPGPAFVYVIGPGSGPQKIGIANDPEARKALFQTGHPQSLVVSHAVEVEQREARSVEQFAHRLLAEFHARGEWFNVTPDQAAEAVNKARNAVRSGAKTPPIALITAGQLRAARALLRWTAEQFANVSGISAATIRRSEPAHGPVKMSADSEFALRRALEAAGVEFISENGGGPGVRMKAPDSE